MSTTQLAVRMTDAQLAELDWVVVHLQLGSRAEGIRKAVELINKELRRAEIDRRYIEAYASQPETEEEMEESIRLAIASIQEEPWEKWW
jgi:metal-responsive CopG/Arc/MetJ family transcriptional regulator